MSERVSRQRRERCSGSVGEGSRCFIVLSRGRAWHFPSPLAFITHRPGNSQPAPSSLLCLVMSIIFYWKLIVWGALGFLSRQA